MVCVSIFSAWTQSCGQKAELHQQTEETASPLHDLSTREHWQVHFPSCLLPVLVTILFNQSLFKWIIFKIYCLLKNTISQPDFKTRNNNVNTALKIPMSVWITFTFKKVWDLFSWVILWQTRVTKQVFLEFSNNLPMFVWLPETTAALCSTTHIHLVPLLWFGVLANTQTSRETTERQLLYLHPLAV